MILQQNLLQTKSKKDLKEAEPIIKRNWKLMYLDTSNLAADQIIKIKEKAQYNPRKADKIGMIRNLVQEGINMPKSFDPHKFFMNTITANKRLI